VFPIFKGNSSGAEELFNGLLSFEQELIIIITSIVRIILLYRVFIISPKLFGD
jgi:hypothetical protein